MGRLILLAILAALLAACGGTGSPAPPEIISPDETQPTFVFFFTEP